jgi:hypothetical protein
MGHKKTAERIQKPKLCINSDYHLFLYNPKLWFGAGTTNPLYQYKNTGEITEIEKPRIKTNLAPRLCTIGQGKGQDATYRNTPRGHLHPY